MNRLLTLLLFVALPSLAEPGSWQPIKKNQGNPLHFAFRKLLDFDRIAEKDLRFDPLECRVLEVVKGKWATVFQSKRLNNCLFETLRKGLNNGSYRGIVQAKIRLAGADPDDDLRVATFRWRPTQVGSPDKGRLEKIYDAMPIVAAVNSVAYLKRLFSAYLSNDLIVDFDRPIKLKDFQMTTWVENLIVGNAEDYGLSRLEIHTAQMEVSEDNPHRMWALILGYDEKRKQIFALDLKLSWGIFNRKKYELDISSVHKRIEASEL